MAGRRTTSRSWETILLILPFLRLVGNFFFFYAKTFLWASVSIARAARVGERKFLRGNHFLAWVSWYSENVAQSKNGGKVRPCVEPGCYCDFVKWRSVVARKRWESPGLGAPPFWRMLHPACRAAYTHANPRREGRRRKLTPSQPPTFQSHWSRRRRPWDTTPPTDPDHHCQVLYRLFVNGLETIEHYPLSTNEKSCYIFVTTNYSCIIDE